MLVEDNPVNQMVTKGMLGRLGFTCRIANNGAEGVGLWQRQYFDLIIMDCKMPVMDGFEATRQIRAHEEAAGEKKRIPIIAITANTKEGEVGRCLAAGMDDYLAKPVAIGALEGKCAHWLAKEAQDSGVIDMQKTALTSEVEK